MGDSKKKLKIMKKIDDRLSDVLTFNVKKSFLFTSNYFDFKK
jgi:hypothetical protein